VVQNALGNVLIVQTTRHADDLKALTSTMEVQGQRKPVG
jgi:hypothetical protein